MYISRQFFISILPERVRKLRFSDVFRGYRNKSIGVKWVKTNLSILASKVFTEGKNEDQFLF